jgi:hypothetical protein
MKSNKEIRKSFYIAWLILSVIPFTVVLLTFFAEKDFLLSNAPECVYKNSSGNECPSCGMTKAFLDISSGDIRSASMHNSFGLFLYSIFIINFLFFISYSIKKFFFKNKHLQCKP